MRARRILAVLTVLAGAGAGTPGPSVHAQEYEEYPMEARVWLDRGHEPILQRGESVRLYYRVSEDAFVAIFHIDTNGTARMVFPTSPQENHFARGGRDYRVLFPGSTYWYVNDDPGMGYFFIVASPQPFDFSQLRYSHYDGGWDLSFVGRQVYRDPYLAMDDYVAALIPGWEYVAYGLDFTAYNVDQRYDYPRFMCYDCHGFRPYSVWNPYHYSCASFRVVIYNDPYYYPVTRYRGTRVVYVQPRRGVAHFGFKERAHGEPGTPQVVVRNPGSGSQPGVAGTSNRRAQPRNVTSSPRVTVPGADPAVRRGAGGSPAPGGRTGAERRPSGSEVTTITPPSRGTGARRGGTVGSSPLVPPRSGTETTPTRSRRITDPAPTVTRTPTGSPNRPVLERRPGSGSSKGVQRTTAPGGSRTITRPSARVRSGGGGSGAASGNVRGGSAGGQTTRPTVRSGGGSSSPPTVRSGGSSNRTIRPAVRSGGSTSRPPAVRSGGTSGRTTRPTVRSGGSTSRPPAVRSGGTSGRTTRPTVRKSGGGKSSPPARSSRPPTVKKRGGGG